LPARHHRPSARGAFCQSKLTWQFFAIKQVPPGNMKAPSDHQSDARLLELDGVRGLAISFVLFEHYVAKPIANNSGWLGDFVRKYNFGWSGVELFFVLSGFLIGGILMDNRASENYFKAFYIRRGCRILPIYFLNLAGFYVALRFLSAAHGSQSWFTELFSKGGVPPLWTNMTFTQHIFFLFTGRYNADWLFVTWSLVVEEQFYLLLPLAIWILRPAWLIPILLSVICLNPLLQLYLVIFDARWYGIISNLLSLQGDALLVGVVCAFLFRRASCKAWLTQNYRHVYVIFFVLALGMIYILPRNYVALFLYDQILLYNVWIELLFGSLLLLAVTHREGIIATMMRFAPLRRLGMISYGVYLFHMPVNGLLRGLILGRDRMYQGPIDIVMTLIALLVTLLVASLSWYFLEKPIIAWGHSFFYDKRDKAVVPVPQIPVPPAS
jgi:peptidoglycan/LPS O-acetylase OafA/YrhL